MYPSLYLQEQAHLLSYGPLLAYTFSRLIATQKSGSMLTIRKLRGKILFQQKLGDLLM